ncbi:MAG: mechanosensitive ion channel [Desulfuromonadales bacterium]|nr:mechanosensitive ion channel [Desulfuromonadales bacterium]
MSPQRRPALWFTIILVICLSLLLCTSDAFSATAEELPAKTEETPAEKNFLPGLSEVIPKSTGVAAEISEADAIISQAGSLGRVYQQLEQLTDKLTKLEERFTNWENAINWPLNRLMSAQASYIEIDQEQKGLLEQLFKQLKDIEVLREKWTAEKAYWQEWRESLRQEKVPVPAETFKKTEQSIDDLLKRIAAASAQLVKKQEEFAQSQGLLANRLNLINSTLNQLRHETFRRNAYSLFSPEFYQQFTPELFREYRDNIILTIKLPDEFWQRQGWIVILQLLVTVTLTRILLKRRRATEPISPEWRFFFKHPIAGAIFLTIAATSTLYTNAPPSWNWLMLTAATIAGTILVVAMVEIPRRRRLIRALAVIYLVSEALKVSGLPTPAYQLYEVILCAVAAPICFLIASRRRRQKPGHFGAYVASLYLISLFALIGLVTALLGFSTLSIQLVDAVLGTIILLFMVRMSIHLADGGITEFLHLNWVRERTFIRLLGISTAERMKTLARIFILADAGLFLPVVWNLYNNVDEVLTSLLSLEYTVGEFSISAYMVVMVIMVLYLTNVASWILQAFADAHYMSPRKMDFGVKTALKRLLHYALFTIGFFIAVSMAGLELQKFALIAGALGVGIGFGLQNIVNNFVSGLILLFERPVKVGDTINIDDQWGTITRIGLRSTVFETLDRAEIIVPNSELISQKVTNWTFTTNVSRIVVVVGVAYGSPLSKVLAILMQVAQEHPDILQDPEPSAIFTGFGDSSINFELRVWVSDINKRLKVKSELGLAIDGSFREEDITIPFPQRDLHLRSIESKLGPLPEALSGNRPAEPEGPSE